MTATIDMPGAQRTLLLHLDNLTIEQERALDAGDLDGLNRLSDQRSRTVSEAAAYLPPYAALEPELADLAAEVQARAESLQHQIGACMVAIRRELLDLNRQQQVIRYKADPRAARQLSWKG